MDNFRLTVFEWAKASLIGICDGDTALALRIMTAQIKRFRPSGWKSGGNTWNDVIEDPFLKNLVDEPNSFLLFLEGLRFAGAEEIVKIKEISSLLEVAHRLGTFQWGYIHDRLTTAANGDESVVLEALHGFLIEEDPHNMEHRRRVEQIGWANLPVRLWVIDFGHIQLLESVIAFSLKEKG